MKLILGIGNPGRKYEATRHNVGFRVVDMLAREEAAAWREKFKGLLAEVRAGSERVALLKPQTYVNLSGESARLALDFFKASAADLLAVVDDVNLPLGDIRFRRRGTSGGHNGLRSLIERLGTEDFPRLRVGVGMPEGGRELVGHVLGGFSAEEADIAARAEAAAARAAIDWVLHGIDYCMNRHNRPAEEEKSKP